MTEEEYKAYRITNLKYTIKSRLHKKDPKRFPHPGKAPFSNATIAAIELEQMIPKIKDLFGRDNTFFSYLKKRS